MPGHLHVHVRAYKKFAAHTFCMCGAAFRTVMATPSTLNLVLWHLSRRKNFKFPLQQGWQCAPQSLPRTFCNQLLMQSGISIAAEDPDPDALPASYVPARPKETGATASQVVHLSVLRLCVWPSRWSQTNLWLAVLHWLLHPTGPASPGRILDRRSSKANLVRLL